MTAKAKSGSAAVMVAKRLAKVKETPVAPAWLVAVALGTGHHALSKTDVAKVEAAIEHLGAETRAVVSIRESLVQLPPAWSKHQEDLLL